MLPGRTEHQWQLWKFVYRSSGLRRSRIVLKLSKRITAARLEAGWSQNELASRSGIKQPTLQRIEAGRRLDPSIRTIAAISIALGISIDALVGSSLNAAPGPIDGDGLRDLVSRLKTLEQRVAVVEDANSKSKAVDDFVLGHQSRNSIQTGP